MNFHAYTDPKFNLWDRIERFSNFQFWKTVRSRGLQERVFLAGFQEGCREPLKCAGGLYARNSTNYQEQEQDLRLGYGTVLLKSSKCRAPAPGVWCSEVPGSFLLARVPVGDGLTSTKRSGQISQVAASGRAECWMAKATTIVAVHYQKWGESFWSPLACKNDCSLSHLDRLTFPLPIIYGPGVLHYLSPAVRPDDALPRLKKDQRIDLWSPEIRAKSTFKSSRTITGLHYRQSRCNFFKWMGGENLWTIRYHAYQIHSQYVS